MKLDELISEIVEDSSSGASQLTLKAANAYLKLVKEKPSLRAVRRLTKLLAGARPSMPSIANIAYRIQSLASEYVSRGVGVEEAVDEAVRAAIGEYKESLRKVLKNAREVLGGYDSILTHSYSSTVAAAAEENDRLKVYVTESRPGYEGRRLAERLARRGLRVVLIVDAAASYVLERKPVDAVVLGCDAILDDGSIANKIGSRMIALAAKQLEVPLNIVTDSWKAAVHGFSPELHPPEEVYGGFERISILNPYFEIVPSSLISLFVSEEIADPRSFLNYLKQFCDKLVPGGRAGRAKARI